MYFFFPIDDVRLFAFARIMTGDELSKRAKFALITWIGPQVSVLKRAKMSTDKSLLKSVVQVVLLSLSITSIPFYSKT